MAHFFARKKFSTILVPPIFSKSIFANFDTILMKAQLCRKHLKSCNLSYPWCEDQYNIRRNNIGPFVNHLYIMYRASKITFSNIPQPSPNLLIPSRQKITPLN